ncbi:MAG TPA: NAD-dependent epimerase/dehydratase family protein [Gaiellaceae bacterium]|nr:NAD-dependent epimerase/dehydratase family protein [Gaiellaceae bacterium]
MRVVVVGASGNAGTSLLQALAGAGNVESVVGIARRRPDAVFAKTTWVEADVERDDLVQHFRGADAVVHLAWRIQPSHDLASLWRTNVEGSTRVFRAVAAAGVPALVYASSIGVYSPAPKDRAVDESWPRDGVRTSFYSRHKAEVERRLDRFERELPGVRVVRLRPALLFKRDAASGIRRLFLGPFLPSPLLRRELIPAIPDVPGLRFQAVHSRDVGEAYRLAVTSDVRGPFNVAAEPVLDSGELARILRARRVPVSARALRAAAAASWRLHLQPTPPGWIDLALGVPVMDVTRARQELGWVPTVSASDAFAELVEGIRERAGVETPPLAPATGGPARVREIVSGIGRREG